MSARRRAADRPLKEERLSFQTFAPYNPRIHLDADVAMVYGIDASLPRRIETWRKQGYRVHVMTGVSWGGYQDYLFGRYDGKNHEDEAQMDRNGKKLQHGDSTDIFYMSPGRDYGRYLTVGVQRALEAGAEAVHLEEPEYWVAAGYSENFKREWADYYKEPWQAPHSSPDAQYRASKLKYFLYRRALGDVFAFVKDWAKKHGKTIPCYVPTHSLINYAHWRIVSPESSLIDVGCDGYISQVWTGTARTPNTYRGVVKERTFEAAFMEYGAMQNLVRASGRRVWYLNDPIEDDPDHSWEDYRRNWENTLTASLFQPEVWHYEIMPWPDRIFQRPYPVKDRTQRQPGEAVEKIPIPKAYETELQTVIRALGDMKQKETRWLRAGTQGIGILVSDTLMFHRGDPNPSDQHLGSFYGLALPLLKDGLPVEPVQIESATKAGFLNRYIALLLTYEGQKPPTPEFHDALAAWVKAGGALIVVDDDNDPYNRVTEWWNTGTHKYAAPRLHLFEKLGIAGDQTSQKQVGKGTVVRLSVSPAALTYRKEGADILRNGMKNALDAIRVRYSTSGALVLKRGPYIVAAVLDESDAPRTQPVSGRFINLFEADLPIQRSVPLMPGSRALLVDLSAFDRSRPKIIAAACRITEEAVNGPTLRFRAEGIAESNGVVRLILPHPPRVVTADGKPLPPERYDWEDGTLRVRFPNSPQGVTVEVRWG